jgi:hypothetical protein
MAGERINFRAKIAGAFDLLFLFGRGIRRFSGTREEALQSVILPLALLPCTLAYSYFYPPKGMEAGAGALQILLTVAAQFILSFVFSNALVWGISALLERGDKFRLFFSASNWVSLAAFAATAPFMIAAVTGLAGREEMDRIFVLLACYLYIVTAGIARRALDLNWQLAGVIAIATLFVNQELWRLIFAVQGIPLPW